MLSKDPLTADQIAIYRVFLQRYDNGSPAPLNLANQTMQLGLPQPDDDPFCLKNIELENGKEASTIVHILDPLLEIKGRVVLVDPERQAVEIEANDPSKTMREGKSSGEAVDKAFATGLLTLSEIAFDKRHRLAVMSFSFECGRTCGHGAVLIFKKKGEHWKLTKRPCVEWVS